MTAVRMTPRLIQSLVGQKGAALQPLLTPDLPRPQRQSNLGGLADMAASRRNDMNGAAISPAAPRSKLVGVTGATPQRAVGGDAPQIKHAVMQSLNTKGALVLAVGYSPTGGGHTARLLNVVHEAVRQGTLPAGSTVILHVPEQWEGQPRPAALRQLADKLKHNGINVVVAEADKSVYGFLDKKTGGSDDASILDKLAHYSQRGPDTTTQLTDCRAYRGSDDLQALPSISAKDLMQSLHDLAGDAMPDKVRVLTDMDPYLQKAAQQQAVPGAHRLDQQNHAILFSPAAEANHAPKNALLAKVLGGTAEKISHIGLGDKNTLLELQELAGKLGLTEHTTRSEARQQVSAYLLQHGLLNPPLGSGKFEGVLARPSLTQAAQVQNIVYVYAHNNTNRIAQHVKAQIAQGKPEYQNSLFLFCGPKAVSGANAMHLAYLGDGDGMTTAGAGTNGEFAWLHNAGEARGDLMVLPIAGHNEQEANAKFLDLAPRTGPHVTVRTQVAGLENAVDHYVQAGLAKADAKYDTTALAPLLQAVSEQAGYVQQAHDLLFVPGKDAAAEKISAQLGQTELSLRQDPVLKANRQFIKSVFQAARQVQTGPVAGALQISLNSKASGQRGFTDIAAFNRMLQSDQALTTHLASPVPMNESNVALLGETRRVFNEVVAGGGDVAAALAALKQRFGHETTTGF